MDNTYNIDFIARCIAGHNKTDIKSIITELEKVQKQVGGVSLVEITQEDYDALTDKDPSTIYLVSNGDKITLYIGGTEVNVQSDWTQTITTADDYIKNKPTLGTAAAKNATDTYNATGTDVTTGKAVAAALATLPEPMVFKGSLGTDGTITTLPTASSSNKGYVYKVITAGIYANLSAKVGDTFISDGSTWVLIPSGDEPSGTVTNVAVANGGGLTVSGSPITSSGTITVGHSNSVTAKTSSSVKKFTYDANGHVTGSSELSTAESNALASGIDSTKVAQITTNENNILSNTAEINGQQNATTDTVAGRGYAIINGQRLYMGTAQTPERTGDIWLDGATVRESEYLLTANPLCGIEDYKDTLDLATGACTRQIKKLVLTGQENWNLHAFIQNLFYIDNINDGFVDNTANNIAISTEYKQIKYIDVGDIGNGEFAYGSPVGTSNRRLLMKNSSCATVTDFTAYLTQQYDNGTPVCVWYILATSTTETITVPTGNTGTVEGYLIQDGIPTPTDPIYPTANQVLVWGSGRNG